MKTERKKIMATIQTMELLCDKTAERFNMLYNDKVTRYMAENAVTQMNEVINQISENHYNTYSNLYGGNSSVSSYEKIVQNIDKGQQLMRNISDVHNNSMFSVMHNRSAAENNYFANRVDNMSNIYRNVSNEMAGDMYSGSSTLSNSNSYYTNREIKNISEYVSGGGGLQGGGDNYNDIKINVEMNNKIDSQADADMLIREFQRHITESFATSAEGIHI